MKSVIVFDDEIFNWLKRELEPVITKSKSNFSVGIEYWIKVYNWTQRKKVFTRYMWNKNKRIQKKWDKIYNDRFKEENFNPMLNMSMVS